MKATKRLAALAAAATMTACMAIPMVAMNASAVGTITITESAGVTSELRAFQIFTAEMSGTTFIVTGWGSGVNVKNFVADLKVSSTFSEKLKDIALDETPTEGQLKASAQAVADVMSTYGNDSVGAAEFARIATQNTNGEGTAKNAGEGIVFSVDNGYYIVVDTQAASNGKYTAYTLGILQVVDGTNTAATVKRDFPTFDKQIGDINDSTETNHSFNEAADHDIGDAVPFKLTATLPSNVKDYTTYKLVFHDDLQADVFELDPNSIVVTYSDTNETGTVVTSAFTKVTEGLGEDAAFDKSHTDGTKDFTLTCNDIKSITGISWEKEGVFEVSYTATLTDKAKLGATGNWNGAYLEYSNNPNAEGTGTSPVDYVVAFTYQAIVNKIDGITGTPLAGAGFTLYKKGADGEFEAVGTADAMNDAKTTFEFKGLDDGTYKLKETTIPKGYTAAADIEFTITAGEIQTDGSEALDTFTSSNEAVTATNVFTLNAETDVYENAVNAPLGAVTATVENKKGATLPSTGGIGTTIFYVVGSLMVGVAGVYLIVKKRMKNNEQ